MKIVRKVADLCPNGIDCPRAWELEGGDLVIQGDTVTDPDVLLGLRLRAGETAVAVPSRLQVETIDNLRECTGSHDRQLLHAVPNDVLVIVGTTVTDKAVLRRLRLPAHESAVQIPAAAIHQAARDLRKAV